MKWNLKLKFDIIRSIFESTRKGDYYSIVHEYDANLVVIFKKLERLLDDYMMRH